MLLVHDIGEIDTGDTIVFAEERMAGAQGGRACGGDADSRMLPEPQRSMFIALWQEFEAAETARSPFAHAADRAMPVLLNLANDGQSWRENGISHERVVVASVRRSRPDRPALWTYLQSRLDEEQKKGWFGAG